MSGLTPLLVKFILVLVFLCGLKILQGSTTFTAPESSAEAADVLINYVTCVFAVSNPIPSNMKSEAKKAAKILRDFTEISNRNGPDKLIPGKNLPNNICV